MSVYNDDELVAPSWINKEFLQKVIEQYEQKDGVVIMNYDLSPATMKGDHYASVMFRCKLSYRFGCLANDKSVIIKTMPEEEGKKRDMLMDSKLFETEIDMYSKTLPTIEKVLAECGEATKLSANLLYYSLEPHKVLVLEDLCESGYDCIRDRYLSEDELKAVYRKIAKVHAVSYMLGQGDNHEDVTKYRQGIFNVSMEMLKELLTNGLESFSNMLAYYDDLKVYYEKFMAIKSDIEKACKNMFNSYRLNQGKGDIFVLNHGDFHMRNLMFKLNEQAQLEDLIMVDYQVCCYGPSNIDLMYSQFMIMNAELRLKRNELMQYYFTEFIRILKKINFQGEMPKFSDFQISGIKYRHYALFLMSTFLPMVVGFLSKSQEEVKELDTAKMFEESNIISDMYRVPAFVEAIRQIMPILLSEGYLD